MATAVSVLCARMRMEEKWVIEALAVAGVPARQLPPSFAPLPIGPVPSKPFAAIAANGVAAEVSGIVLDRCADRTVARVSVPMLRAAGCTVIDAGLAASGSRLDVACALASSGIPRPTTSLVTSEDAGAAAAELLGWPVTLLPLNPGTAAITLLDRDIAEATLEHREVLGGSEASVALIQAGAMRPESGVFAVVVAGKTAGMSGSLASVPAEVVAELAEATAHALGAMVVGVEIAVTADGPVVWDVRPVPEFRSLSESGQRAVASAISGVICAGVSDLNGHATLPAHGDLVVEGFGHDSVHGEVADVVALSA